MPIKKNPVPRIPLPPKEGEARTYVTAQEAANSLGIKVASLYAYVSRGVIRSIVQPGKRQRLYYREDVERAAKRMGGRAGIPDTVEAVLSWGQPVVQTAITDITDSGPLYRGRPAIGLATQGRSFESVCELLWTGMDLPQLQTWEVPAVPAELQKRISQCCSEPQGLSCLRLMALSTTLVAVSGAPQPDFERGTTISDSRQLMTLYCGALGLMGKTRKFVAMPRQPVQISELLLTALLGRAHREGIEAINRALVLCADHELTSSTLSARIAASCGSELRACLLAAIGTHGGLLLAGGCDQSEVLLRRAGSPEQMHALMQSIENSGARIPGYNMKAYPKGDPRALMLIELAVDISPKARRIQELVTGVEERFDLKPSLEVGLVALSAALDLPEKSASAIWSLARMAGWVAHIIEQRQAGFMVRPRAKYVGPSPIH